MLFRSGGFSAGWRIQPRPELQSRHFTRWILCGMENPTSSRTSESVFHELDPLREGGSNLVLYLIVIISRGGSSAGWRIQPCPLLQIYHVTRWIPCGGRIQPRPLLKIFIATQRNNIYNTLNRNNASQFQGNRNEELKILQEGRNCSHMIHAIHTRILLVPCYTVYGHGSIASAVTSALVVAGADYWLFELIRAG